MRALFGADPQRFDKFSLRLGDILFDYSKNRVTEHTMALLFDLARQAKVEARRDAMAPKTTGHKFTDQARSLELCEAALGVACERLKPGGSFVVKIFQGPDAPAYLAGLKKLFASVRVAKPKSSRAESKEIFYVGTGFTGGATVVASSPDPPLPSDPPMAKQ